MKKKIVNKETKVVLSKKVGWIILIILVLFDASLDLIFAEGKGLESNILKPVASLLGTNNPLFLTPVVLILFYFVVKGGAWLTKKADKIPVKTEELVLTALVIVYGILDLWLISVYFFNFTLIKRRLYLIIILIIVGVVYSWWAEKKLTKLS